MCSVLITFGTFSLVCLYMYMYMYVHFPPFSMIVFYQFSYSMHVCFD